MPESVFKELIKAEQLMVTEKYTEALKIVKDISKSKDLTNEEKLACILLESRIIFSKGDKEQSIKLIENIWPKISKLGNLILILDYLSIKTNYLWSQRQINQGIKFVEEHAELIEKLEAKITDEQVTRVKHRKCAYFRNLGILYWYSGDLDTALDFHQQGLAIAEELYDKIGILNSYNNIGLVYGSKGDVDKTIEFYKQALKIAEELDSKPKIARILSNLGNTYATKGELDEALTVQLRSLELRKKFSRKRDIAITLLNVGVIYQLKGELNEALTFYKQSLHLSEELEDKSGIANALNNIGNILELKGEIDLASDYYKKSLKLYNELGIKEKIALLHSNIGANSSIKGDIDGALENFNHSLEIYEEMGNIVGSALVLSELINKAIEKKDQNLIQEYLEKLKQINKSSNVRKIDQCYRLAKALSLKQSDQIRNRTKAIVILEQVIEEKITDHSITVKAMIHLTDLLITELKQTAEKEVLIEIKDLVQKLHNIAEEQESNSLLAEIFRLEALLALSELDLKNARELLHKGITLAEKNGLEVIVSNLCEEQINLEEQIKLWEDLQERKAPLKETLQHVKIEESVKKIQQEETMVHKKLFSLKL